MDIGEVKQTVRDVLTEMRLRPIPLGISNRHLHLSQQDYDLLFPNQPMAVRNTLKQPGQYAAAQTVTLAGPKGQLERVRILGPVRSTTQVEISKTDARTLGIQAPIRLSGDLAGTPGIRLITPDAELQLNQGVIVALRHIHMSPLDALIYGVRHGDSVAVAIEGTHRNSVFEEVSVRVSPDMVLEMHLDTDEANAADADNPKAYARILGR
ncbi:phosphate propanoyltransferase [Vibrio mangrovi]|uniref:Phosphate propanoyltransferase n=1 Tax=Vibrio mangrovi TaxID=474394 RepID=A0A1Y6J1M9_9VIBR|nr:phosphate propanoyltransferase [Vibrio mangrovi]MDW6005178.1 phosphate propanoyltransferase [Vibrio mangrovi]SMS02612.1 Phosphate propanoyltransferase [Vibrio mangrovi]